jgi:hypothetical protein
MQKSNIYKNAHLLLSAVIIIPIALVYGVFAKSILPELLDFKIETTDLSNAFRSIMGLYMAFAFLWILGILKPNYWKAATISNILFMGGLAFGRIVSLLFDGLPSTIFVLGTAGELILTAFGVIQLQQYNDVISNKE